MGMDYISITSKVILNSTFGFYSVSVVFAILRVMSMVLRSKPFRWYDMLMAATFTMYSGFLGFLNLSVRTKANLFVSATQVESVLSDPKDVHNRIIGSILVALVEQSMLLTLWGVKWCILVFMYPFANQAPKGRFILHIIAGYAFICFFVFEILYFGVLCVPFSQYWAVPVSNIQCASYNHYHKIQLAFNISTYCLIMGAASAILARSEVSAHQKLMVWSLLALGVITVAAAVGNKLIKINSPEDLSYALFYIMETSVAIWISNAMYCWPVIQKLLQWISLGHFRSFYVVRNPSPARIAPQPEQGREVSWWREFVARIKGRRLGTAAEQDVEMNDRAPTNLPPGRHAMSASRGTTILMHAELSDYLENGPATPHSQALTRDNDTSPALIYREINKLD